MLGRPNMNKQPKILVIIPAYNEERNIAGIMAEVREKAPDVDIFVVDDGSEDRTAEIARQLNATVVSHPFTLRIGGAVQTGFKFAKMKGYDIAIQVDGDGQHDPTFIPQLVKPITEGKADISIGSRYLYDEATNVSLTRYIGVRFFSWMTTKITGRQITDCASGFRALSKRAIDLFADEYPVDFPDAEALIVGNKAGLKISEIPVKIRTRKGGESSLYFWRLLYYPIKEIFSIMMLLTEKQRRVE